MALCAMGPVVPTETALQRGVSLSRRITVREERAKGWRTRSVDHMTESELNATTWCTRKTTTTSAYALVWMMLTLMGGGVGAVM